MQPFEHCIYLTPTKDWAELINTPRFNYQRQI